MPLARDPSAGVPDDVTDHLLAIRHFTNREASIGAFSRHLAAPEGALLPVLSFYGVGGIGKTLLLRKLAAVLAAEYPGLPHARLDFEDQRARDPVVALASLKVRLERDFGLRFPEFDIVNAVLMAGEGGAEEDLVRLGAPAQAAVSVASAFAPAPIVAARDLVLQAVDSLRERAPWVEEKIRQMGGTEQVLSLRTLDPHQLRDRLLRAFARELSEGLPAREGRACRGVLFIDTFEKLWDGRSGPTDAQGAERDAWVRDLYAYLAHSGSVLLVIAGRDFLAWRQTDPSWAQLTDEEFADYLDAHIIGGLSPEDAQQYLARCGVGHSPIDGPPTRLQAAIAECARGEGGVKGCHPLLVGLCANIVLNERRSGEADPEPEFFEGMPGREAAHRLAQRFLRSLADPAQAELVQTLSVPRIFDLHLVRDRLGVGEDAAKAAFDGLAHYSFTEPAGDGMLSMHSVMRDALQYLIEQDQPERVTEVHHWCRDHWRRRMEGGESRAGAEGWYHWMHIDAAEAVESWCGQMAWALGNPAADYVRTLIEWWEGLDLTDSEWRPRMGDAPWAGALLESARKLGEAAAFHASIPEGAAGRARAHCEALLASDVSQEEFPALSGAKVLLANTLMASSALLGRAREQAISLLHEVEDELSDREDSPEWAGVQWQLSMAYAVQARFAGEEALDEALSHAARHAEAYVAAHADEEQSTEWAMGRQALGQIAAQRAELDPSHLGAALEHFDSALSVLNEDDHTPLWASIQMSLGGLYLGTAESEGGEAIERAIEHLEAAMCAYARQDMDRPRSFAQSLVGQAYGAAARAGEPGRLEQALEALEASCEYIGQSENPNMWAAGQASMAEILLGCADQTEGAHQRAVWHLRQALGAPGVSDAPEMGPDLHAALGDALRDGPSEDRPAALREAISHYERSLPLWDASDSDRAIVVDDLARAWRELSRECPDDDAAVSSAIERWEEALALYEQFAMPGNCLRLRRSLGSAYGTRANWKPGSDFDAAIAHLEAARDGWSERGARAGSAEARAALAYAWLCAAHATEGDPEAERALTCLAAAANAAQAPESAPDCTGPLIYVAGLYLWTSVGDPEANRLSAAECCETAIAHLDPEADPDEWIEAHTKLADACANTIEGDTATARRRAIEHYLEALAATDETQAPAAAAGLHQSIGGTYLDLSPAGPSEESAEAVEHLQAAVALIDKDDDVQRWADIHTDLSLAHLRATTDDEAGSLRAAIDAGTKALNHYTDEDPSHNRALAAYNVACAYARTGDDAQALDLLEEARTLDPGSVAGAGEARDLVSLRDNPRFRELTSRADDEGA